MENRRLTIALCDDDPLQIEELGRLVLSCCAQKSLSCDIRTFPDGEALLAAIDGGERPDLVFLDIYMNTLNGIAVAGEIRKHTAPCAIIFVTSSPDHALEGYRLRAVQYLLKPVTAEDLEGAMDQALGGLRRIPEKTILIENRQGSYRIPLSDIVWIESSARVLTIHTRSQGDIAYYSRLDDCERECDDDRFLRCHKSFLVNLDYVQAIVNRSAILKTGGELPISANLSRAKALFASRTARNI